MVDSRKVGINSISCRPLITGTSCANCNYVLTTAVFDLRKLPTPIHCSNDGA